jgi:hypothetical protein
MIGFARRPWRHPDLAVQAQLPYKIPERRIGRDFSAIISFEQRTGDVIGLHNLWQAHAGWHKTCFELKGEQRYALLREEDSLQQGQSMRYLHDTGAMQSDPCAARAATHGHSCGGLRQIMAARTLIHRFTRGNDTATLQSRKITCRQSQI